MASEVRRQRVRPAEKRSFEGVSVNDVSQCKQVNLLVASTVFCLIESGISAVSSLFQAVAASLSPTECRQRVSPFRVRSQSLFSFGITCYCSYAASAPVVNHTFKIFD